MSIINQKSKINLLTIGYVPCGYVSCGMILESSVNTNSIIVFWHFFSYCCCFIILFSICLQCTRIFVFVYSAAFMLFIYLSVFLLMIWRINFTLGQLAASRMETAKCIKQTQTRKKPLKRK